MKKSTIKKHLVTKVLNYGYDWLRARAGLKEYQPLFEKLYSLSVSGMNYGHGADFNHSGELECLHYVKKLLRNQDQLVMLDVGANTGEYAKQLLNVFGENSIRIYCFEPSGTTFRKLTTRLGAHPNVTLVNKGLGEETAKLKLYTDKESSELASVYKRRLTHINIDMSRNEEIEITTLDEFCAGQGIKSIDFLKLDVEGHELKVLAGARQLLENNAIAFIQIEFGGCNIDSRTYFQDFFYLLKDSFNMYRIMKNGLHPIREYKETLEIFTTVNYLAELKQQ